MSIENSTEFLIVDDSETVRKDILTHLNSMGLYQCTLIKSPQEALKVLKEKNIDIILSGNTTANIELLAVIRKDPKLYAVPFIMIVSEIKREAILEAIDLGVSSVLMRPYTISSLTESVQKALLTKPRKILTAPRKVHTHAETERLTVLIVDDTSDNLYLLSNLFKDEYRIKVAQNGQKALEICTSDTPPDLVLLDVMMQQMDGFTVAKKMREHPNAENIPIIFVTAMTSDDARIKGLELGAVDFVTKPVDPDILKPRVRNLLRHVELYKNLQSSYDVMLENARLREAVESISNSIQYLSNDETLNVTHVDQLRNIQELALSVLSD